MNLISSKTVKRLFSLFLCICILLCTSACAKRTKNIKDVDQICVSGSYTESWMGIYIDETFINEMVKFYNDIKYEKTDESIDMLTAGECLSLTYSKGTEKIATIYVGKSGLVTFEAGTQTYKIVSEFDFDYLKGLVDEQKEKQDNQSTDDEI